MSTTAGGSSRADERLRDREPVGVGEMDVEQDDARVKARGRGHGRRAVLRLAHDVVAVGLEHPAGERAERRMVIDDEHGRRHRAIVRSGTRESTGYTLSVGGGVVR